MQFGNRVMAVRAKVGALQLYIVCAYAPHSGLNALHAEHDDHLSACFSAMNVNEILVMGTDANRKLGAGPNRKDSVTGPFTVPDSNPLN